MTNEVVEAYLEVGELIDKLPADEMMLKAFMCATIDVIAGKLNKNGYELVLDVLPMMYAIGNTLGVMQGGER